MMNNSGLKPLGRAVLLQTYEPEKKNSLIEIPDAVKNQMAMVEQRAIVVDVGDECWIEESKPRAKPGDKVIVTKFAGYITVGPKDGAPYRLVNDRDVFAAITEESEDE